MKLDEFISKIANSLEKGKIITFFFNNKNVMDTAKGLSIWLNISEEKLKNILNELVDSKIIVLEYGMYYYKPSNEIKGVLAEFNKYYKTQKNKFIDAISEIPTYDKELEEKLEKLTEELFEKNRVLFILQEINEIINSPKKIEEIIDMMSDVIELHLESDGIFFQYKLSNISGEKIEIENSSLKKYVISNYNFSDKISNEVIIKFIKEFNFKIYKYDIIGENNNKIAELKILKKAKEIEEFEKDLELLNIISSLIGQMLEKQNYFIEKIKKEKLEVDLELAKKIQLSYIPETFPEIEGFQFASIYKPARMVGGDYYDWFQIGEDKYSFVIGDVSGKGSSAALYMVKARENFRVYSKDNIDSDNVLECVNDNLSNDVDVEKFMTAFYFTLDLKNKKIKCSNAGHDPLLIVRDGKIIKVEIRGLPLGIIESSTYQSVDIELKKGDVIVVYTDGIPESRNLEKEFYEFDRFLKVLKENYKKNPNELVVEIENDVKKFIKDAPQHDDFTMFIIKYNGKSEKEI
ncbi:PP2C family protein-serine/threonine phosphatase [Haliovirga abyssi]|uniref:PPM-type phosphatase domain-containing protein n=1 Tax=Haliovirga abyssi TaxID=2996794 RepID=A0AAU9DY17_9FUSO|nr:SpoIIE family protein phosphatase [Haliovirga abyssi]BDU50300.1 hypothetical protein HLVA_08690 [Haliovirga abyssi]